LLIQVQEWLNELAMIANENKRIAKAEEKKYIWYSTQKNKDIKAKFSLEGEKLSIDGIRFSSRSSGDSSGGEWLYDFTLRKFDESNYLLGIHLAVEIELSDSKSSGLVYDFNKLLQADSPYKCFVFQQKNESLFNEILGYFDTRLNIYNHRSDSEFLIAGWITSRYKFVYQKYKIIGGSIIRQE
jgi:hypothetical protein